MSHFMSRALALAVRGRGKVSPNPLVGAVLVKQGKIIAEGWHRKFGLAHAEIEALENARKKNISVKGAALYVNLEPCVHEGKKTPPCVPAIISAGISRVVVAMRDPNPLVSGRGIRALRKAGIEVSPGCLEDEAVELNRGFSKWIRTGMPFVVMKVGMSLDGKIATRPSHSEAKQLLPRHSGASFKTGDSKWITGEASRAYVRLLRDTCDAILVGKNTVKADDPVLAGKHTEPHRIILDSHLEIPLTRPSPSSSSGEDAAPMSRRGGLAKQLLPRRDVGASFHVFRDKNVSVITTAQAPSSRRDELQKRGFFLKIFPKKIAIPSLLSFLGSRGITSVFVEGGAEVFGSFVDARAIDEIFWFIAPKIIGGRDARAAVSGKGVSRLADALALKDLTVTKIGSDLLLHARV